LFLTKWGTHDEADRQFMDAGGIAAGPVKDVHVTRRGLRVRVYNASGDFLLQRATRREARVGSSTISVSPSGAATMQEFASGGRRLCSGKVPYPAGWPVSPP
jgi:hypothetical protein